MEEERVLYLSGFEVFHKANHIRNIFAEHNVEGVSNIDKINGKVHAFVEFETMHAKLAAIPKIGDIKNKKNKSIKIGDANPGHIFRKRKVRDEKDLINQEVKKPLRDKDICEIICPLWNIEYQQQLIDKTNGVERALKNVVKVMNKHYYSLHDWKRNIVDKLICPLLSIIPSTRTTEYRNKSEFTCDVDIHGLRVAGFNLQRKSDNAGYYVSLPDDRCNNIPRSHRIIAESFSNFMQKNPWDTYDRFARTGVWRQFIVRSTERKQLMIIIQVDSSSLSDQEFDDLRSSLLAYLLDLTSNWEFDLTLHSLVMQSWNGPNSILDSDTPFVTLYGPGFVIEELCGLKFKISPDAFFQVNTKSAELLFSKVGEWIEVEKDSILLDICCGTGTIGLTLANRVARVIGFEIVPSAIKSAIDNAELNNISNASFICGPAESTLPKALLGERSNANIIAIVDPPRPGLHKKTIVALRNCRSIKCIIYVSCNPASMADNVVNLLRPTSNNRTGDPFFPEMAIPVDMFPGTNHCECVMLLKRK